MTVFIGRIFFVSVWERLVSVQPETDLGTELEGGCVLTVKELRGTFGRHAGEVNSGGGGTGRD